MKLLLFIASVVGVGMCLPGPIAPTLRFHARRQASIRIGDLIQEFALDLSDQLWANADSVVFSPLSISSIMSVLMMGSSGVTYHQLRTALYYPQSTADFLIHRNYKRLNEALGQTDGNVVLNIATRLFLQSGSSILSDFTQQAQENYNTSVRTLQFRRDPIGAMDAVNDWVNIETRGKIPELIVQPFKPSTTFVAANTVYFNGAWETPFNPMETRDGLFDTGTANITVPMMRATVTVPYVDIRELKAKMIALPYKGREFAMFFVVPNGPIDYKTLQEVEFALTADNLSRYIADMANSTRKVFLPRMKLNYRTYLKDTLRNLDVTNIFDSVNADFSNLTADDHVWVDDMIHATAVEITETGTEAAAATAVVVNRIGTSNVFEINKPCIFFIRHMQSGLSLFWGRILKPTPLRT